VKSGYDVAIVGAGLVGCAAAYELARRGRRVVVLDQGELNRGASGRNAGSLHFQIEPRMLSDGKVPRQIDDLIAVNLQAIEDWRNLPFALQHDIELVMNGGLMVAETDSERDVLQRKLEVESSGGLPVDMVEGAELRRIAPCLSSRVRCAIHCSAEGHANPRLVTPAFESAARKHGAHIMPRSRVRSLEVRASGCRLHLESATQDRNLSAGGCVLDTELVLVAAGAWSREILAASGVEVQLQPLALVMNVTERCGPILHQLIQHIGRSLSVKQVEAGNVLIGGGWPAELVSSANLGANPVVRVLESSVFGNIAVALDVVPALARLALLRTWTGIACVSADHLPVLGPVSALPGVFIAAGGSSFTLGPTYARMVGELMHAGQTSMPVAMYRPDRFKKL